MKTRKLIKFSEEAKEPAIELYNEIEASQQPGGRLEYAKDHGSKLFENITRVAGLLTYYARCHCQRSSVRSACKLG